MGGREGVGEEAQCEADESKRMLWTAAKRVCVCVGGAGVCTATSNNGNSLLSCPSSPVAIDCHQKEPSLGHVREATKLAEALQLGDEGVAKKLYMREAGNMRE